MTKKTLQFFLQHLEALGWKEYDFPKMTVGTIEVLFFPETSVNRDSAWPHYISICESDQGSLLSLCISASYAKGAITRSHPACVISQDCNPPSSTLVCIHTKDNLAQCFWNFFHQVTPQKYYTRMTFVKMQSCSRPLCSQEKHNKTKQKGTCFIYVLFIYFIMSFVTLHLTLWKTHLEEWTVWNVSLS